MVKKKATPPRRGDKRERNRAALVRSAAQIINEKGCDKASLEEIAKRCGLTRGAIYNNFKDKDDLFLAVLEETWKPIVPPPLKPGATLADQMRNLGMAVVASAPDRRKMAVGALSFQLYALSHKRIRARFLKINTEIYKWAEAQVLRDFSPKELPLPPADFVRVLHALTEGLLMRRFLTPELISDETIVAAFEAMA
jgi:AcrR family transcriptional regulator